jgi:putative FmdB family regulatory protein
MPIYEYKCTKCGKTFEELVTSHTATSLPCPSCESAKTERIPSVVGGFNLVGTKTTSCPSAQSCAGSGNNCSGCCPMA